MTFALFMMVVFPRGEAMNDYCDKTSVCYETLDQASKLAKPNWFMA